MRSTIERMLRCCMRFTNQMPITWHVAVREDGTSKLMLFRGGGSITSHEQCSYCARDLRLLVVRDVAAYRVSITCYVATCCLFRAWCVACDRSCCFSHIYQVQ